MNVYDPTTSTLSVTWEHADGPVMQYRITYAPTVGDPIDEYVRIFKLHLKKKSKRFSGYFSLNPDVFELYLFSTRQQCQETKTMSSCKTWIQTRLITSKSPQSIPMDPEESWKETDTHVRTFLSSQPNKTKNKKFDAVPVLNKLKEIIQEPGSQY